MRNWVSVRTRGLRSVQKYTPRKTAAREQNADSFKCGLSKNGGLQRGKLFPFW